MSSVPTTIVWGGCPEAEAPEAGSGIGPAVPGSAIMRCCGTRF